MPRALIPTPERPVPRAPGWPVSPATSDGPTDVVQRSDRRAAVRPQLAPGANTAGDATASEPCRTTESTRQEASSSRAWHRAPEELAQPGSLPRHRREILDDTIRATAGLLSDHQHTDRPAPRPIAAMDVDRRT